MTDDKQPERCLHCAAELPARKPGVRGRRRQFCTPWHGKAHRMKYAHMQAPKGF